MVEWIEPVVPGTVTRPAPAGAEAHPMRRVTLQIAFEPGGWTPERQAKLADLFDGLAPTWPVADEIAVAEPLADALDRGMAAAPSTGPRRTVIDLGGGNGRATPVIVDHLGGALVTDLSHEMLRRVPAGLAPVVEADAARLPLADDAVDVLVCANMFLFPHETARVLRPDGVLVWVNSWGPSTPIHLTAAEVDEALPGDWSGVASAAGEGTWSVHWPVGRVMAGR